MIATVTCVGCGAPSPEAESLYVLIGEHGWRPLHDSLQGEPVDYGAIAWRCPACWSQYKETASRAPPSSTQILARALIDEAMNEGPPKKPDE
jgi:hypothetical protein